MLINVINLKKDFMSKLNRRGVKNYIFPEYKKISAVKNISFDIEQGEIVAFIGPNGAGKSTTIKMLTGIVHPTSGDIQVAGLNPAKQRKELAFKIGCMFGQKSQLYLHLSVIDSYRLLGAIYDLDKEKIEARITYVANLFKIEHLLSLTVRKLSLGQRMICEIAACILHEPQILFLDEPTIGLDIVAKIRIREIIKMLNKEHGTTIFLTSHDIADVESLCKRIIVINEGKIVIDSSIDKIKEEFLSNKLITVSYDDIISKTELEYNAKVNDGNQIIAEVDTKINNIKDVITYLISLGNVVDVKIDSTPLETVIKEIYEKRDEG